MQYFKKYFSFELNFIDIRYLSELTIETFLLQNILPRFGIREKEYTIALGFYLIEFFSLLLNK
jgi:hypothetical protein